MDKLYSICKYNNLVQVAYIKIELEHRFPIIDYSWDERNYRYRFLVTMDRKIII